MDPAPLVTAAPKSKRQRRREMEQQISLAAAPTQVGVRKSRVEVSKLDLWSVLKVSLCFYLAALAVLVAAGVVVWLIADAAGVIHNVEKFVGKALSSKNYHLVSAQILEGSLLVGLVFVAMATIITVIAAALYNLFSELLGGVEVTLVESQRS
jgi:hypothetical protein